MKWWVALTLFVGWCFLCLALVFVAMLFTQMGDCFEVKECWEYKNYAMRVIMVAGPILWLLGAVFIVRQGSRRV